MSEHLSDEQKKKLCDNSKGGMVLAIDPITIHGEIQDKTTLVLQIEIIEYERLVSKRS